MKIALCFYGMVGRMKGGGIGDLVDWKMCFDSYKQHLIDCNGAENVDIFMHCWTEELEEEMIDIYKPTKYEFQKQIQFNDTGGIIGEDKKKAEGFRYASRYYSNKKVIKMKRQYEKDNKFKYDCVMALRYDLIFCKSMKFEKFDQRYFWASHRNRYPRRRSRGTRLLNDLWFFSNSELMDYYADIYTNLVKSIGVKNIRRRNANPHAFIPNYIRKKYPNEIIRNTFKLGYDYDMYRYYIVRAGAEDINTYKGNKE